MLVLSEHPEVKLFIGGYGDEEKYIRHYVRANNLDGAIQFVGYVPNAKKGNSMEKETVLSFPRIPKDLVW